MARPQPDRLCLPTSSSLPSGCLPPTPQRRLLEALTIHNVALEYGGDRRCQQQPSLAGGGGPAAAGLHLEGGGGEAVAAA